MVTSTPQLWPPPADFSVMLQNPKLAFKDPDLKTCLIARDSNNQPKACSGAFAVVYKGTYQAGASRKGDVAIRVFSSASNERQDRYKAISEYLKQCPLNCLVDFEYMEKGILHGKSGKWYPLIRMEWVQGDILFNYARDRCQAGDHQALSQLSDRWIELVTDLSRAKIAHGDLQHANVMVTDRGELKLVDYDCMCVPALVGRRNLELGVVPYQNPKRNDDTLLFPGLDNFSALFIFVVLRALSASPRLWDTYVEPQDGQLYDKLLIRDTDFQNPGASNLYRDLKRSSDQKVSKLADTLFGFWNTELRDIPHLSELVNDFEKVRQLLTAKAFDEALELLNLSQPISPPPKELQVEIDNAKQRVKCREELEQAIQIGDELAIKQKYRPQLLDDYQKAAPAVAVAKTADQAIAALKLLHAAKSRQDWRAFVKTWEQESGLLAARRSAAGLSTDAVQWKKKNEKCDEVWRAYRRRPPDFQNLLNAWQQLEALGGHPEADAESSKIEDLIRRYGWLSDFTQLKGAPGEQLDSKRRRAWRESDFKDWDEAEKHRPEFDAAESRLQVYNELCQATQQWPDAASVQSEQTIVQKFKKLPTPYEIDAGVKKRVIDAHQRLQAFELLRQAMGQSPLLDTAVGKAWQDLVKVRGQILVPTKHHRRLDLAVQRLPMLTDLTSISLTQRVDHLDEAVLKTWVPKLLSDFESDPELRCLEAEPWRLPYQRAVQRRELLQQLKLALSGTDASTVKRIAENPLFQDYPFPSHIQEQISTWLIELDELKHLIGAIRTGDRDRFQREFNASLIKRFPSEFQPLSQDLDSLIVSEILPQGKNGFRRPLGSQAIVERNPGQLIFDIQWSWPERRILDRVVVGICRGNPPAFPDSAKLITRISTDRQLISKGSGRFVLPAKRDWLNMTVVVWGVIDLGFREYFTEPFTVGRLSSKGGE